MGSYSVRAGGNLVSTLEQVIDMAAGLSDEERTTLARVLAAKNTVAAPYADELDEIASARDQAIEDRDAKAVPWEEGRKRIFQREK
jgi:hypothetical protein